MKTTKSRSCSVTAAFVSILLAVVLVAGCAPRVIGIRHVPGGDDMTTMIRRGEIPYTEGVPAIALNGTGAYTVDFSATMKATEVTNTRMVMGETTSLISSEGKEPRRIFVVFYLCQPLSSKADRLSDNTIVYGGNGYPNIIKGQTYVISGILQPHWQGNPLVYVPTASEFKQTTGSDSFVNAPKDALVLEVPAMTASERVVREYFKYWSEGNYSEMKKDTTLDKRGFLWEQDNVESIELQHLTERTPTENNREDFVVIYRAKLKKAPQYGLLDDTYTYECLLKRDDGDSPWLIYDWEVSGE